MKRNKILVLSMLVCFAIPAVAQQKDKKPSVDKYADQTIDVGTDKIFTREESTASVSVITNETTDKRSAKNIGNSILGQGSGLISLQNAGNYAAANPTFYVRGLQSLSGSTPLILVDGIERSINNITPEEVESVSILKDAAAVALYGYKGANGAILVTTKRGIFNSKSVKVTYDHIFNFMANKPKFVDAATYASALNEARANDGLTARYTDDEIAAFKSGQYPYLYPNVNWVDETFKDVAMTNKYNIEFRGGGKNFRYYTMVDLISDKGFIANPNENDSYSTQNKYVKGNLRTNLDIDLTPTTKLKVNILGVLQETSRPGESVNLWSLVYSLPSAAFPIKDESGNWGGNSTWAGTSNPVAESIGAAYTKNHTRSLFSDATITQDLSGWVKGLAAKIRVGYDNTSNILEDHSKTFVYGSATPGTWVDGAPTVASNYTGGSASEMSTDASTNTFNRRFHFDAGFDYDRVFGKHSLYSQLRWDYEFEDSYDSDGSTINTTVYRQNFSWWTHYGFKSRYFADLALVESGSNRLAPGTKWNFSPTLSAAWVLSKERFMKNVKWVNFLKLRASAGMINADYLPEDSWSYYTQQYTIGGSTYPFNSSFGSSFGVVTLDRLATENPSHEKAYKYNFGADATLFNGLDVSLETYFQHRTDIWVESSGKYTALIGNDAPYENAGIVNSWGFEASLNYNKKIGEVNFNIGGEFNLNRNKIIEQLEEPRLYSNLVQTGNSLSQVYGLEAIGFFKDQDDIDNSPTQTFSTVKPGDIKYKDVNDDGKIDSNDKVAIGYSTAAPQLYYSIHLGVEWKGFGIDAMFQGVGRYSAVLNTTSMYWPLINNTTISQYYYDNRWTTDNTDAKFPRLSSSSNANNYQTNTVWLADRSFLKLRNLEVYYNFPAQLLSSTKFINAAKLYVRGIDLFSLDHLDVSDPESYGASNPLNRSLVLGLSVTF
jgi:TonB-linked SusC/RagA family outer membrane protein